MAGSAASEGILFVGAILVATAFVGVLAGVVQNMSGSVRERGGLLAEELENDVTIINDPAQVPNNPVLVYVKNTGARSIATGLIDVLVDGQAQTGLTYDVLESTDDATLPPGDVVKVTVTGLNLASGDHRIRVVVEGGANDDLRFNL